MPDQTDYYAKGTQGMDGRKFSLRHVVFIPVMCVLLIGASAILFLIDRDMTNEREQDVKDQAVLIINTIRNAVEIYGRPFLLDPVIEAMVREKNVNNISIILSYTGEIAASSENEWKNQLVSQLDADQLPRAVFDEFTANNLTELGRMQSDGYTYTYAQRFSFRLDDEGEILRPVLVLVQLDTFEKMRSNAEELQILFLISILAIIITSIFLYVLFAHFIFNPINNVISVIDRRAEGDKSVKAKVFRHDEIGMLALNLNILVDTEEIIRGELAERERELRVMFDAVPLKILCKDNKNNLIKINKATAEMLGTTVEEGEGRNMAEFVSKEQAKEFFESGLRVITSGDPELNVITKYQNMDGTVGWVRRHRIPYASAMGGEPRVLVVIEDITALVESEKRLERVIEASRDGIHDCPDISKPEQYWSPQFKAMLGYSDFELEPSRDKFLSIIHPDDLSIAERNLKQQIETGKPCEYEYRLRCKNGEYKWFLATSIAFEDETSGLKRICGTISDIQDRKEAEQQLAMYMAELERSNNDLAQFARIASHDLKAPLRGIAQLISWIEEDLKTDDHSQIQPNIDMIQNRIVRLERLLNDLLTFSHVGRRKESCRKIAVEPMVREIFEISHPPKGFKLVLEGELPEMDTLAAPFELILRNLIANAIKHHGDEKGTITVSGKAAEKEGFYEFSVSDDGQGIDPKYHKKVFEMFSSLRPKDEVEGTGMGLSIVEKILRTYGGEIYLESVVGEGTTLRFLWPMDFDL